MHNLKTCLFLATTLLTLSKSIQLHLSQDFLTDIYGQQLTLHHKLNGFKFTLGDATHEVEVDVISNSEDPLYNEVRIVKGLD